MSLVLTQNGQDVPQSRLESLRRSEAFGARLLETSRDCGKVLNLDARLQYMNEGGMAVLEICDLGPMIGSSWIESRDREDKNAVTATGENFFHLPAQHLGSAFDARYALARSILWEMV